jgi:hypothetical protein
MESDCGDRDRDARERGKLDRQTLEDPARAELAASATAIRIGAWDTEGLIFWELSRVPGR